MSPGSPEDTRKAVLEAWNFLTEPGGRALLEAAAECPAGDVTALARLRRTWSREQVTAAMELTEARQRARGRFHNAETIMADRTGLEQATGSIIARYKADRIADAGAEHISDLCCGIGGDTMALAGRMEVTGFDIDPVKAWMTRINASCETRCADILETAVPAGALHVDPSRRDDASGTRRHDPQDWLPSATALQPLLDAHPDAAIKMGPGIDQDQLVLRRDGDEVEFISLEGKLSQAVLWTGRFARTSRRATRCSPDGAVSVGSDQVDPAPIATTTWSNTWLHVPDPALERARLLGSICREWNLAEPAAGLGLLVGPEAADSSWLVPYQVVDQLPWRVERIKQWLRDHDAGVVEIRTRGRAVPDVDRLRRQLSGQGKTPWTIFGLRLGASRVAVLTRPRGEIDSGP